MKIRRYIPQHSHSKYAAVSSWYSRPRSHTQAFVPWAAQESSVSPGFGQVVPRHQTPFCSTRHSFAYDGHNSNNNKCSLSAE